MKTKRSETKGEIEKMIYDLFKVCDETVDIKSFVNFENEFSKVIKGYGFDLHQIYYGKSFEEMKKTYRRYDQLKELEGQ
jgi:hypothetical protein